MHRVMGWASALDLYCGDSFLILSQLRYGFMLGRICLKDGRRCPYTRIDVIILLHLQAGTIAESVTSKQPWTQALRPRLLACAGDAEDSAGNLMWNSESFFRQAKPPGLKVDGMIVRWFRRGLLLIRRSTRFEVLIQLYQCFVRACDTYCS